MIGRLTGTIAAQEADGAVVIDVAGVGYELAVPLGTTGRAPVDEAGRVTLWVHTHVREDALALFGFSSEAERAAFRALVAVSNVGPKIAIAVLGALPAAELARAIGRQDAAAMKGIPGVGKKIADRLMLELRGKLRDLGATTGTTASTASTARRGAEGEDRLRSALIGMGFKPAETDRVVASIGQRTESTPVEALLREALAMLAR